MLVPLLRLAMATHIALLVCGSIERFHSVLPWGGSDLVQLGVLLGTAVAGAELIDGFRNIRRSRARSSGRRKSRGARSAGI